MILLVRLAGCFLCVLCLLLSGPGVFGALASGDPPLRIFAAASLKDVITAELARQSLGGAETAFAASSTLARQIGAGAGAHVFLSADPVYVDALIETGRIQADTAHVIARNVLVLASARRGINSVPFDSLEAWVAGKHDRDKLVLGDPGHVPAGRYARQALKAGGLWAQLRPHAVFAADARAALALLASGEAALGVIYASDVRVDPRVRRVGDVPASLHSPIAYVGALTPAGTTHAQAAGFLAALTTPAGQKTFQDWGFARADTH